MASLYLPLWRSRRMVFTLLRRWGSFQSGQGGDPRTDWGISQLIRETLQELGAIHSVVIILAVSRHTDSNDLAYLVCKQCNQGD